MLLFDTHAHYNLDPIWSKWQEAVINAKNAGITQAMVVGTDNQSNQRALELKESESDFFRVSLGLHPLFFLEDENKLEEMEVMVEEQWLIWQKMQAKNKFEAYGEIGLDFFHLDRQDDSFDKIMSLQVDLLQKQLQELLKRPKPVILHVRDNFCQPQKTDNAYGLVLQILKQEEVMDLPLIFHCFSGTKEYLQAVLKLPQSYVSFAGNLTFKSAHQLRELCSLTPAKKLLLETDAPFLSPEPKRGQPCRGEFLAITAKYAEKELKVDLAQIYENSQRLFNSI